MAVQRTSVSHLVLCLYHFLCIQISYHTLSSCVILHWYLLAPIGMIQSLKIPLGWHTFIKSQKIHGNIHFLSSFAAMSDFHVRLFRSKGLAKIEPCAAPLKKKVFNLSLTMIYHNYADYADMRIVVAIATQKRNRMRN